MKHRRLYWAPVPKTTIYMVTGLGYRCIIQVYNTQVLTASKDWNPG